MLQINDYEKLSKLVRYEMEARQQQAFISDNNWLIRKVSDITEACITETISCFDSIIEMFSSTTTLYDVIHEYINMYTIGILSKERAINNQLALSLYFAKVETSEINHITTYTLEMENTSTSVFNYYNGYDDIIFELINTAIDAGLIKE